MGINLRYFYDELKDSQPSDWLPDKPLNQIIARHTVGLETLCLVRNF